MTYTFFSVFFFFVALVLATGAVGATGVVDRLERPRSDSSPSATGEDTFDGSRLTTDNDALPSACLPPRADDLAVLLETSVGRGPVEHKIQRD